MAGAVKQVAIRLKPEGGAEVTQAFRKIEEDGVRAAGAVAGASDRATQAAARQEAQWRRNAEAMRMAASAAQAQSQFNTALGVGGSGAGSASASADVFAAAFRADEDAARRAAQLKAEIDPLAAATDRYNAELREYEALQKRGAISTMELAKAQELAKGRLDATTAALGRNTNGLTRNQMASRLNLSRQAADVVVTASMGMNPAMIAMQQGPQIADALATSGLKASASMLALGGALAVAAGAGVAAVAAWKSGEEQSLMLDRAVTGLGRTAGLSAIELETLAMAAAEQGEVSVRSARAQAAAYVSTGKIGGEIIGELIALGKDYAAVFGLEAEEATQSLAKAMAEPDKAARELTRQMGLLDQVTLDHIDSLVKHGDRLGAQKILLDALSDAVDGQADRIGSIETAWDAAARAVSNYWDKLGRALYTTPDERVAGLNLAIQAERRKIGGGSERMIARLETQRDELQAASAGDPAAAAEAAANQAAQEARDRRDRAPRGRRDNSAEREAREALQRARQEEDRAAQIEMEEARGRNDLDHIRSLEREEALRTRVRQLVDDDVASQAAKTKASEEQARLDAAREVSLEREFQTQQRALGLELDRLVGNDRTVATLEREEAVRERILTYQQAGYDLDTAKRLATADQLELDRARAEVLERQVAAAQRDHDLEVARAGGRDGAVRLLERDAQIASRAREIENRGGLNRGAGEDQARREVDELTAARNGRAMGEGVVSLLRSDNIWEEAGRRFKDAAWDGVEDLLSGLFQSMMGGAGGGGKGGGGGLGGIISGVASALFGGFGKNARGTDYWSGGWTWVGEEGPELIRAPQGAQIADADRSRRMAATGGAGGVVASGPMRVEIVSRLEVPPGYVPDRQLAAMLSATHDSAVQTAVGVAAKAAQGQQLEFSIHKG